MNECVSAVTDNQRYMDRIAIGAREASELLGLSRRTVQLMAKSGRIPHRREGKKFLFSPRLLRKWMDEDQSDGVDFNNGNDHK